MNRLDPANKSICFSGFQSDDVSARVRCIEAALGALGGSLKCLNIEHVWKGAPGNRSVGPLSIVEFASRTERESVLKKFEQAKPAIKDISGAVVSVARAKTSQQLKRNGVLKKCEGLLKNHASAKNKVVKIEWQLEGSKSRSVIVGDETAFLQCADEISGNFVAPFLDCSL